MISSPVSYPGDRPPFREIRFSTERPVAITDIAFFVTQSLCRICDLSHQAVEQLGESYRGFKVGCAVLALDESTREMGIIFGGNYTPYQGAEWNCAEKRALEAVQSRSFNKILAIAVSGPPQIDKSGLESPTLHPCYRCRDMLDKSPIVEPNTLVATSNLDETRHELFTVESLICTHQTLQEQPFPNYHPFLLAYWNQLQAFNPQAEKEDLARLGRIAQPVNGGL